MNLSVDFLMLVIVNLSLIERMCVLKVIFLVM